METLRLNALAIHLGVDVQELGICAYDDQIVEYGSEEYLVVTDSEADDLWDTDLDNYLEEFIDSNEEVPETFKRYFDREAWKSDARHDGRAHSLNRYDGNEDEVTVYEYQHNFITDLESIYHDNNSQYDDTDEYVLTGENKTFYIYRQN